jgi:hypothetical protein
MKVALAFWGITRSLKYTIKSIKQNILNVLEQSNIDYDIYIHTYKLNLIYSNKRANEKGIKLDSNEYKLLNPHRVKIDIQEHIKKRLNMRRFRSHPDPWNSNYETVDNFICAMYSKMKVTKLIEKTDKYDYVIFLRPDVKYLNKFDIKFFDLVNNDTICIPNFHLYANFNDRFCITNYENALLYGNLYKEMLLYSRNNKLHSETFNNHFIRNIYNLKVETIPFYFNRVRVDGKERNDATSLVK